jgi:hypothetical protein
MATIPKRAVVDNGTGGVLKSGRSDFTGQFNPAIETQYDLLDIAEYVSGVPFYYHKVVGGMLIEMTPGEKSAVDTYRDSRKTEQLRFIPVVGKVVANLAALPVPPPQSGVIVGVQNIGGSRGFVLSTGTDYLVFVSDGTHP